MSEANSMMDNLRKMAQDMGDEIEAQNKQLDAIVTKSSSGPRRGAWTSQTARRSSPAVDGEPVPASEEAVPIGRGALTQQMAQTSAQLQSQHLPSAADTAELTPATRGGTRTRQTARRSTGGKAPRKMLPQSQSVLDGNEDIEKDGLESVTFTTETAGKSVGGAAPFSVRIFVSSKSHSMFLKTVQN